jgi:hypothetical protein
MIPKSRDLLHDPVGPSVFFKLSNISARHCSSVVRYVRFDRGIIKIIPDFMIFSEKDDDPSMR